LFRQTISVSGVRIRRSAHAMLDAVKSAPDGLIRDGTLARIYSRYGVLYRQP
jgi:hypothetical protein